jgi:hypothetical protein
VATYRKKKSLTKAARFLYHGLTCSMVGERAILHRSQTAVPLQEYHLTLLRDIKRIRIKLRPPRHTATVGNATCQKSNNVLLAPSANSCTFMPKKLVMSASGDVKPDRAARISQIPARRSATLLPLSSLIAMLVPVWKSI